MPISNSIKKGIDDFFYSGNDHEDTYDEDFDASTDSEKGSKNTESSKVKKSNGKQKDHKQSYTSSVGPGSVYSEPLDSARKGYNYTKTSHSQSGGGGYKRKKDRRKVPREFAPRPPQNSSMIAQRVLSARRNKINSLQNLVLELQSEVDELRIENRDLKRSSRIQEKAIKRLDNEEADLPLLLQKHNSEVRALKGKLKKEKEVSHKIHEEVKKKDLEIMKLRDKVKKYEEIMREKRLDERDRLQSKLEKLELELGEKEGKILELEKVVRLGEKVRARELKERNDKYKRAIGELRRLEDLQKDLQGRFKEKEKELQTQNIYSQRIALKRKAMKSQLLSMDLQIDDSPTTSRSDSLLRTPREENLSTISRNVDVSKETSSDSNKREEDASVETMVSALRKKEEELEKILEDERKRKQFEEDKRKLQEMEDRIKQKQDEIRQADRYREESGKQKEILRKEEEARKIKDLEYRARQREEEKKTIWRLEEEKAKEEQRRLEEERRRFEEESTKARGFELAEEELTRKLAEQENRNRELNEQLKTEQAMVSLEEAALRKKELLLARMKAIDSGRSSEDAVKMTTTKQIIDFTAESVQVATTPQKKKPIFLQNSGPEDDPDTGLKHKPLDFSSKRRGSKTDYNFKTADENLHRGLPSHPDLANDKNASKNNKQSAEYSPTIGSGGTKRISRFKNSSANSEKKEEDFLFFDTKAKKSPPESSRRTEKKEKEDFLFFDTKKAKAPIASDLRKDENALSKNSANSEKKPDLNRNRTRSISDDDSQMFTIGGKQPDKLQTGRISAESAKAKKPTVGSGKRVFGSYEPTFGMTGSANSTGIVSPDSDPFADDGPKFGRRHGNQKNPGAFGDNLLTQNKQGNKQNDFTNNLFDDSRKKAEKSGKQAVTAIDSFVDDDIEEMVLT